jgi:hypothetical protein
MNRFICSGNSSSESDNHALGRQIQAKLKISVLFEVSTVPGEQLRPESIHLLRQCRRAAPL